MFNIADILFNLAAGIIALTLHESVKAFVSSKLGDPIPKREGRVTLNPLKHIEPVGLILLTIWGYGWGKPVRTTALYYKNAKRDTLLTYTLPSLANFVLGVLSSFLLVFFYKGLATEAYMQSSTAVTGFYSLASLFFTRLTFINLAYTLINIIPVYPMDGSKILLLFLKPNQAVKYSNYEKIMQFGLILIISLGLADSVIYPIIFSIMRIFLV